MNRKMKYFQKCDFLLFFYTFLLEFEHYMCLLNIRFALFVAKIIEKQFVAQIYWFVLNCVQENYRQCHAIFIKWVG